MKQQSHREDSLSTLEDTQIEQLVDEIPKKYAAIQKEMGKTIIGQHKIIELLTIALLCEGHCILHGVPGLAKTLIISTLAQIFDVVFKRIQFTPDLMPADIIGTELFTSGIQPAQDPDKDGDITSTDGFHFRKGPLFGNIILADEINRTPPKTQSALLEAMQEKAVTAFGKRYPLAYPFFVFATQNPIEQEGTYRLPEAQLDRFLFNIEMTYPEEAEEIEISKRKSYFDAVPVKRVLTTRELRLYQQFVEIVPISESMIQRVVQLAKQSRPEQTTSDRVKTYVQYGAGPRASQNLVIAAKAHAALNGRPAVNLMDIKAVAYPVLNHRLILNFAAHAEQVTTEAIIKDLVHESLR